MFIWDISEKFDKRDISRWPASILADKRTDKVIGRMMFLTVSIKTIKFIRALGVPIGVRWIIMCLNEFFIEYIIMDSHKVREIGTVIEIWAFMVKLKGASANKFNSMINKNILFIMFSEFFRDNFLINCLVSFNMNNLINLMELFFLFINKFFLGIMKIRGIIEIAHLIDRLEEDGSNIENRLFIIII